MHMRCVCVHGMCLAQITQHRTYILRHVAWASSAQTITCSAASERANGIRADYLSLGIQRTSVVMLTIHTHAHTWTQRTTIK